MNAIGKVLEWFACSVLEDALTFRLTTSPPGRPSFDCNLKLRVVRGVVSFVEFLPIRTNGQYLSPCSVAVRPGNDQVAYVWRPDGGLRSACL